MWGNIVAKQKPWGEHYNNPQCFKKKITKQNRQRPFWKKRIIKQKPCRETLQ